MLLVEDNSLYSGLLVRRVAEHCALESVHVESGLHALQFLQTEHFDLVVADMRLPGLAGTELLRLASTRWPDMGRILLTGYTSGELVEECAGYVDRVFDKLVDVNIICDCICRLAVRAHAQSA